MKNKPVLLALLTLATLGVGGAAWLASQSGEPVGAGKTVHMLAVPT